MKNIIIALQRALHLAKMEGNIKIISSIEDALDWALFEQDQRDKVK
jgi:hypothetical protein